MTTTMKFDTIEQGTPRAIAVSMRSGNVYRVADGCINLDQEVDDISFRDYYFYHEARGYRFYVLKSIACSYGINVNKS